MWWILAIMVGCGTGEETGAVDTMEPEPAPLVYQRILIPAGESAVIPCEGMIQLREVRTGEDGSAESFITTGLACLNGTIIYDGADAVYAGDWPVAVYVVHQ
jgi:hypothetical protein